MRVTSKACNIISFGLGVVFVILGIALGLCAQTLFEKLYKYKLQLSPSSSTYKLWSHTPVPLYLEVYLFNWTNAEEFIRNKSTVPNFEEVGPFVFSEVHDRVNVTWNDNNTVTYNQTRRWNFIPELSEDLSVEVTNLNVIGTTISQMLKNYSRFKQVINWVYRVEHFVNTAPAKNWIFEGIDDRLMEYISVLEHIFNIPPQNTKFGWFYGRNMSSSYDGKFTVQTGTDSIYKLGIMDKWNGMNQTGYYKGACAMVNGSSGELFPPMDPVTTRLTFFVSDLCSSIKLVYNDSSFVDGMKIYTYVGDRGTFDNGQYNPSNKCFCRDKCPPNGARDVSACHKAPLYFSFPHFYLADESYRRRVSGMRPNESEHQFVIRLDPGTGLPTDVRAQLQINVRLEPIPWLKMYADVPEIYMPMMWFRERAKITPELLTQALLIHILPQAIAGLCYGLLGLGTLIVIVRLFIIWRNSRDSDDSELLIPPMMDDEDGNGPAK